MICPKKWRWAILWCGVMFWLPTSFAHQCYSDAMRAYQALMAQQQATKTALQNVININTAHPAELMTLKGVGVKTAQAIVDYRELMGEFKTVDELTKVKGVGQKTLDVNRQRLSVR